MYTNHIKPGNTRQKRVDSEIRNSVSLLLGFEKNGSVGRWETKHFMGMVIAPFITNKFQIFQGFKIDLMSVLQCIIQKYIIRQLYCRYRSTSSEK